MTNDSQQRLNAIESSLDRQDQIRRFCTYDYSVPMPPPIPERTKEQLAQMEAELVASIRERQRERGIL